MRTPQRLSENLVTADRVIKTLRHVVLSLLFTSAELCTALGDALALRNHLIQFSMRGCHVHCTQFAHSLAHLHHICLRAVCSRYYMERIPFTLTATETKTSHLVPAPRLLDTSPVACSCPPICSFAVLTCSG
jgi:hypothetical protein